MLMGSNNHIYVISYFEMKRHVINYFKVYTPIACECRVLMQYHIPLKWGHYLSNPKLLFPNRCCHACWGKIYGCDNIYSNIEQDSAYWKGFVLIHALVKRWKSLKGLIMVLWYPCWLIILGKACWSLLCCFVMQLKCR